MCANIEENKANIIVRLSPTINAKLSVDPQQTTVQEIKEWADKFDPSNYPRRIFKTNNARSNPRKSLLKAESLLSDAMGAKTNTLTLLYSSWGLFTDKQPLSSEIRDLKIVNREIAQIYKLGFKYCNKCHSKNSLGANCCRGRGGKCRGTNFRYPVNNQAQRKVYQASEIKYKGRDRIITQGDYKDNTLFGVINKISRKIK